MSSRVYKPSLALVTLLIVFVLQVRNVEGLTVSGRPEGNATINAYDLFEIGIKLREGQAISYSYDAGATVIFMLHRHEGSDA